MNEEPKPKVAESMETVADYANLLKLYIEASKREPSYALQIRMAENCLRLGNTEAATAFTILASNTRNADLLMQISQRDGVIASSLENSAVGIEKAVSRFGGHAEDINKATTAFSIASNRVDGAAQKMSEAAGRINR